MEEIQYRVKYQTVQTQIKVPALFTNFIARKTLEDYV